MDIEGLYAKSARLVKAERNRTTRFLYDRIIWDARMVCIKGARGVGKSTLMLQRMNKQRYTPTEAIYVSLDDLWFSDHRLTELADYHSRHGGAYMFIDEVHRYPYHNWAQELKTIYDGYPDLKIVFSGSSILQIDLQQADLSRRCIFYDMPGLSFREYLMLEGIANLGSIGLEEILCNHETLAQDIASKLKIAPTFEAYLRHGYYPFYRENLPAYPILLEQMVKMILDVDLPSVLNNVEYATVSKMKRLLTIISQTVPFTLNATKLGSTIETSRQMIVRMLGALSDAKLLTILYSGKANMGQLGRAEKLYFDNTNLMHALASATNVGTERETFFANQLKQGHAIAYTSAGDFLVDDTYTFEVGGEYKDFSQIKDIENSFLVIGDAECGHHNRIPLWLFGLMY